MSMAAGNFKRWKQTVDAVMLDIYCINTVDAGLNDEWLKNNWRSGEAPKDFVEWFGQKYDLTSKHEVGLAGGR